VIVEPSDYPRVLEALSGSGSGSGSSAAANALRFELAKKAFAHTASYDTMIAATLDTVEQRGEEFTRRAAGATSASGGNLARGVSVPGATTAASAASAGAAASASGVIVSDLPEAMAITLQRLRVLRYGENPHQQAGWYAEQPPHGF